MILRHLALLNGKDIVLGSGSPRRKEILETLGLRFRVQPSGFAEDLDKAAFSSAAAYVRETCLQKLRYLLADEKVAASANLVICADTVVVRTVGEAAGGWQVLEKPSDRDSAVAMLQSLSGDSHEVLTAVAFATRGLSSGGAAVGAFDEHGLVASTTVHFAALAKEDIDVYVNSGEPFDKAGGYGIQGQAGAFVERIEGCFYNVMGFPMQGFAQELSAQVPQQ
mmetsp:Transcript_106/g.374  ORF Transcript_106/g.374 Transcript_106/m.374 type:complete len:223 (+) Transcript_106:33-701(+)